MLFRIKRCCNRCGKPTSWSKNVVRVENPIDESDYSDFHETCFLKDQLESQGRRIEELIMQLGLFNRLNLEMIVGALNKCIKKTGGGAGKFNFIVSDELFKELSKDPIFNESLIIKPFTPLSLFGIDISINPNIVGWYITKKNRILKAKQRSQNDSR